MEPEKCEEHLVKLFCDKDYSSYLIMYARFLTSLYLKQNAILFEGFFEGPDLATFCTREVETFDNEADQLHIIGVTNYLGIRVEINSVRPTGKIDVMTIPEDGAKESFLAHLLFVPGHYDALYP